MFEAIRFVAGWFSLAAFLAAVVGLALRHYWQHKTRTLEALPRKERAAYSLAILDRFPLNTENMSSDESYRLARQMLEKRAERFSSIVRMIIVICVLGLIAFLAGHLAPLLLSDDPPSLEDLLGHLEARNPGQEKSVGVLEEWSRRHRDFFDRRGYPTHLGFADIWSQTFSSGRVLYNSTDNWLVVMFGDTSSYHRYTKPGASITVGPGNREINEELLSDLLSRVDKVDDREFYRDLVDRRKLMGGIGTVYIRESLRAKIGAPLASEFSRPDALVASGPGYEMVVSLRNDKNATEENDIYILWASESRFEKHSLFSWRWKPRSSA